MTRKLIQMIRNDLKNSSGRTNEENELIKRIHLIILLQGAFLNVHFHEYRELHYNLHEITDIRSVYTLVYIQCCCNMILDILKDTPYSTPDDVLKKVT